MKMKTLSFDGIASQCGDSSAFRFISEGEELYFKVPTLFALYVSIKAEPAKADEVADFTMLSAYPFDPVIVGADIVDFILKFDKKRIHELKLNGRVIPVSSIELLSLVLQVPEGFFILKQDIASEGVWNTVIWKKITRTAIYFTLAELQNVVSIMATLKNNELNNNERRKDNGRDNY